MSSCAAFSCMCFPKALSAFATLASSPTDGGLLSCPSAFNSSVPYHNRRQNQQHPPPSNPALFVAVPNVAAVWWSSRDLRLPRSNSVLPPLSPESPHETDFPKPQPRSVFRLDPPSCALPPNKVPLPDPESVPIANIFYFHHPLPALLLFSHQGHCSIADLMPPIDPN